MKYKIKARQCYRNALPKDLKQPTYPLKKLNHSIDFNNQSVREGQEIMIEGGYKKNSKGTF